MPRRIHVAGKPVRSDPVSFTSKAGEPHVPDDPPPIRNFRDVGGCLTRGGPRVRRGLLFRGAQPEPAPAADAFLRRHGIERVVDLRTDAEVAVHGSPGTLACERVHLPFLVDLEPDWVRPLDRSPAATGARYHEYLSAGRERVARLIGLLLDERPRATLVHCVSGRDRTGIVAACLLSLLGVPDEAIAADYALSSVMDDAEGRSADPGNITAFLATVRARHGSLEAMLGAGPRGALPLATLRRVFLE